MRIGIYKRVSVEEKVKQGYSLESQQDSCMTYCTENNHELYKIYTDDGFSAKNMKRPALQEMLEDIRKRKIDIVLFWRLDRLSRNSREGQYMIYDIMQKYGVSFISMTEQYDTTTAQGRMVLGIMLSIAQGERETIAERVRAGMEKKFLSGKRNGAMAAFGFKLVDGQLEVMEEEAKIVRYIYSLYQNNFGMLALAGRLNEENVAGKRWNYTAVYYILNNPLYSGQIRWNYRSNGRYTNAEIVLPGEQEAIVSIEEYNRCQTIRRRRGLKGKSGTSQYPFSGIVYCNRCGYAMVGNSRVTKKGRRRFYRCSGRYNYGNCNLPLIGEKEIEKAFFAEFDKPKKELIKKLAIGEKKEKRDKKNKLEQLQKDLEAIQARRKKWQLAYAADAITLEELHDHNADERKKELKIREQLEELPDQIPSIPVDEAISAISAMNKLWEFSDNHVAKKLYLSDLFKSIHIDTSDPAPRGNDPKVTVDIIHWEIY